MFHLTRPRTWTEVILDDNKAIGLDVSSHDQANCSSIFPMIITIFNIVHSIRIVPDCWKSLVILVPKDDNPSNPANNGLIHFYYYHFLRNHNYLWISSKWAFWHLWLTMEISKLPLPSCRPQWVLAIKICVTLQVMHIYLQENIWPNANFTEAWLYNSLLGLYSVYSLLSQNILQEHLRIIRSQLVKAIICSGFCAVGNSNKSRL